MFQKNYTSIDKLYLLSAAEVWANTVSSSNTINKSNEKLTILPLAVPEYADCSLTKCDKAMNATRQLDYYKNLGITTNNYSNVIKKNGTSASYWWLRSAIGARSLYFFNVSNYGYWSSASYSSDLYGVSPAFRIG